MTFKQKLLFWSGLIVAWFSFLILVLGWVAVVKGYSIAVVVCIVVYVWLRIILSTVR